MPSQKKYPVELSPDDRQALVRVTMAGEHKARLIMRARVLLALDVAAGPVDDRAVIAARVGVAEETVRLISKRFVETGGDVWATVQRKVREHPPVASVITGDVEARLIALACTAPPEGRSRWSLRLLEKHVALAEDIPDLDHTTISRVLKKRDFALI
jgi:Homeodomain-like domain